jgi:IS1 family transposase
MYHSIRDLMSIENDKVELSDVVEMDETYVGGKPRHQSNPNCLPQQKQDKLDKKIKDLTKEGFKIKKGSRHVACAVDVKRGRGTKKIPVVGIVQRDGDVVAEVMRHTTYENLKEMLNKYVDKKDSVLITDDYKSYNKFNKIIEHVTIDHKEMYSYKGLNTNTIESFWAFIKRQIIGQHHHVSAKYLPKYVAETVFKFNNRGEEEGTMFEKLVKNAMLDKE